MFIYFTSGSYPRHTSIYTEGLVINDPILGRAHCGAPSGFTDPPRGRTPFGAGCSSHPLGTDHLQSYPCYYTNAPLVVGETTVRTFSMVG